MNVPFELHVALRYLLARRKQAFISVISLISTLGVIVGVMALIVALALMTGLQQELRDRILGSNPHVYVWNQDGIRDYHAEADRLRRLPHVTGAAPAEYGAMSLTVFEGNGWACAVPMVSAAARRAGTHRRIFHFIAASTKLRWANPRKDSPIGP